MAEVNLVEAVNLALAYELEHDRDVILLGEDIGVNGGVFRATAGLQARFGSDRVVDTPLAEAAIAGVAIGMAAAGLKPVAEIQFTGFMYPTIDQIINHAARLRHRTRGRLACPMVLRAPSGAGIHAPEHHSESPEALFAHVPGLRMVMPSSPARAYGLLLSAIRDPDPVIFFEPTRLYRLFKQDVEDIGDALPLDVCFVLREGSDLTLASWGAMLQEALAAADALAKTGRCVIVHEAARSVGCGAEIAAGLAEHGLTSLLAPVQRVTGYDVVVPLPRLESQYMPSVDRIMDAARKALEYA